MKLVVTINLVTLPTGPRSSATQCPKCYVRLPEKPLAKVIPTLLVFRHLTPQQHLLKKHGITVSSPQVPQTQTISEPAGGSTLTGSSRVGDPLRS